MDRKKENGGQRETQESGEDRTEGDRRVTAAQREGEGEDDIIEIKDLGACGSGPCT